MGTPEEHQREEVAALRAEVAALRESIAGIPEIVKAAIREAAPAATGDPAEHNPEP